MSDFSKQHEEATSYANSVCGKYVGDFFVERIVKVVIPIILVPYFSLSLFGFKPEAIELPLKSTSAGTRQHV
jgi:hypothetical protein